MFKKCIHSAEFCLDFIDNRVQIVAFDGKQCINTRDDVPIAGLLCELGDYRIERIGIEGVGRQIILRGGLRRDAEGAKQ